MNLRNVLIVSYRFPPLGGSGVQRAVKLARYLPAAGWRAHILTAGHTHDPQLDANLSEEIGAEAVVHRVLGFEPGAVAARICRWVVRGNGSTSANWEDRLYWRLDRWWNRLRRPEPEMLWIRSAARAGCRIVREHDIQAVMTTSPPHSTQWVGRLLQRRLSIPWIADLRDPILDNFAYDPANPRTDRYWRRVERMTVNEARRVVATCPELTDRLRERYSQTDASRFSTITNGYDDAERPSDCDSRSDGRFVLGYVGSFYRDQTVEPLLQALRRLTATRPDLAGRFELRVIGSVSAQQTRLLRDTDDTFLKLLGYRSHGQAIEETATADALFLMTPVNQGGRYCIPSKTFEYLAFGRHIIALVHGDTTLARTLAEAGNVTLINHDNSTSLMSAIEDAFAAWSAGKLDRPRNQGVVERFRRDRLAADYARLLSECVCRAPAVDAIPATGAVWEAA